MIDAEFHRYMEAQCAYMREKFGDSLHDVPMDVFNVEAEKFRSLYEDEKDGR